MLISNNKGERDLEIVLLGSQNTSWLLSTAPFFSYPSNKTSSPVKADKVGFKNTVSCPWLTLWEGSFVLAIWDWISYLISQQLSYIMCLVSEFLQGQFQLHTSSLPFRLWSWSSLTFRTTCSRYFKFSRFRKHWVGRWSRFCPLRWGWHMTVTNCRVARGWCNVDKLIGFCKKRGEKIGFNLRDEFNGQWSNALFPTLLSKLDSLLSGRWNLQWPCTFCLARIQPFAKLWIVVLCIFGKSIFRVIVKLWHCFDTVVVVLLYLLLQKGTTTVVVL